MWCLFLFYFAVQEEIDRLKSFQQVQASVAVSTEHQKPKHSEQLSLSKKLDKLILKSSCEAGLKL